MLKLVKAKKTGMKDVDFTAPFKNQKLGLEMLITLNTTDKDYIIGPDVGEQVNLLVTKEKPHYYFNPVIEYKDEDNIKDFVKFTDYLGNIKRTELSPFLEEAIKSLKPTKKKTTRKKKANASKSRD